MFFGLLSLADLAQNDVLQFHPLNKCLHELKMEFSKEEVQMASKYMKKCLTSMVIK
jgi:hypothetical protein